MVADKKRQEIPPFCTYELVINAIQSKEKYKEPKIYLFSYKISLIYRWGHLYISCTDYIKKSIDKLCSAMILTDSLRIYTEECKTSVKDVMIKVHLETFFSETVKIYHAWCTYPYRILREITVNAYELEIPRKLHQPNLQQHRLDSNYVLVNHLATIPCLSSSVAAVTQLFPVLLQHHQHEGKKQRTPS